MGNIQYTLVELILLCFFFFFSYYYCIFLFLYLPLCGLHCLIVLVLDHVLSQSPKALTFASSENSSGTGKSPNLDASDS